MASEPGPVPGREAGPAGTAEPAGRTVFRPSLAGPVLALGRSAVGTAVVAVAYALVAAATGNWARTLLLVLLVVGIAATLALGLRVLLRASGRGPRLELDDDGWTNTTGRAPRRIAWTDVRTLSAVTTGGRMLLVAELADGRTSAVLLRRLRSSPTAVEAAVRQHLNAAHGYTPFR